MRRFHRNCVRLAGWVLAASLISFGSAAGAESVELVRSGTRYRFRAEHATLESIAKKFHSVLGIRVELAPRLKERAVTASLSPRPAERILWSIARRTDSACETTFVFRKGQRQSNSPWSFAVEPVHLKVEEPRSLEAVLREIPGSFRVEGSLDADARLFSPGLPLYRVLDSLAAQTGSIWSVEVRMEPKPPGADESVERAQGYFAELAKFTSPERREEMSADLDIMLEEPSDRRARKIDRLSRDIRALPALQNRIPGEHRSVIARRHLDVLRDLALVLEGRNEDERSRLAPLISAVDDSKSGLVDVR